MRIALKGNAQRVAVYEAVKAAVRVGEDGLASYPAGVSDHTIAASMPFPCSHQSVGAIRREVFGKMYVRQKPPTGVGEAACLELLAALEARVEELEARVWSLTGRPQ